MACTTGISAAILSDCSTKGTAGLEVEAYMFNRNALTITYDGSTANLITDLANIGAGKGYKITGYKKNMNAGSDGVVAEDKPDSWKHYFSFKQYEVAAAKVLNVDNINDVVVFVESKNKPSNGDGVFIGYGCKFGLYKSSDTHRSNDNNAERAIELTSMDGGEEPYSRYVLLDTDYATTKALLESLD